MPILKGENMKIWYDACTGKHLRYGIAIARRLRSLSHEVTLTTRKHPDTLLLAELLKEKVIVAGQYNPKSLQTRLEEGIKRQLLLCRIAEKEKPKIAISHGSVDQCRVAFGLGIPIISTLDTPYAEAVHRLTLPLSDYIVISKAIPKKAIQKYNVKAEVVQFDGVDEVAWIKDFKPVVKYDFGKPLIVVREYEEKAVYAKKKANLQKIAKELTKIAKVVFLSRYTRKKIKDLIVPQCFIDSASLVAQADLFVGVGGTITREAALQGTPAIIVDTLPKQHVNTYLIKKGFPIFKIKPPRALETARKLLGEKYNVKHLLGELENPSDVIAEIVRKIG